MCQYAISEISEPIAEQLERSLLNALKKFDNSDEQTVNIIVLEINSSYLHITICDILFGKEKYISSPAGRGLVRENNGLFTQSEFYKKVNAVLVRMRKNKWDLMCAEYWNILCVSNKEKDTTIELANHFLTIDKVFESHMFPVNNFFNLAGK